MDKQLHLLKITLIWYWLLLLGDIFSNGQTQPKTKLCGNKDCNEVLFEAKVIRTTNSTHPNMLSLSEEGVPVKIVAIKFSDRPDFWEAEVGVQRGYLYKSHVTYEEYLDFLTNAVQQNKKMYEHTQEKQTLHSHNIVGTRTAVPDLVLELDVLKKQHAEEQNLPVPEPTDLSKLKQAHGGHEHSHGAAHGHSHGIPEQPSQEIAQNSLRRNMQKNNLDVKMQNKQPSETTVTVTSARPPVSTSVVPIPVDISPSIPTTDKTTEPGQFAHSYSQNDDRLDQKGGEQEGMKNELDQKQENNSENNEETMESNEGEEEDEEVDVERQNNEQINVVTAPPITVSTALPLSSTAATVATMTSSATPLTSPLSISVPTKIIDYSSSTTVATPPANQEKIKTEAFTHETRTTDVTTDSAPSTVPITEIPSVTETLTQIDIGITSSPIIAEVISEPLNDTDVTLSPHRDQTTTTESVLSASTHHSSVSPSIEALPYSDDTDIAYRSDNQPTPEHAQYGTHEGVGEKEQSDSVKEQSQSETVSSEQIVTTPMPLVRSDLRDRYGQGYCQTGELCDNDRPKLADINVENEINNGTKIDDPKWKIALRLVALFLKRIVSLIRSLVPFLAHFDDAGVLIILIVPAAVAFHCICLCMSTDPHRKQLDRRHYAFVCQENRALKLQVKQLQQLANEGVAATKAMVDVREHYERAEMARERMEKTVTDLSRQKQCLEEQNDSAGKSLDTVTRQLHAETAMSTRLHNRCEELERHVEALDTQLVEFRDTCEQARQQSDKYRRELNEQLEQCRLLTDSDRQLKLEVQRLRSELKTCQDEVEHLQARKEALENESVQLSQMIGELRGGQIQTANGDSNEGGSVGWSDIGDFGETDGTAQLQQQSKRPISPSEAIEAARLRIHIKKIESDLAQSRLSIQKESDSSKHLELRLKSVEDELMKTKEQLDQKEKERLEVHAKIMDLLTVLKEKDAEMRSAGEEAKRLRDQVQKESGECLRLKDMKIGLEERVKDLEQDLVRHRKEKEKLDMRYYSDLRELKSRCAELHKRNFELTTTTLNTTAASAMDQSNVSNNSSDPEMRAIHESSIVQTFIGPQVPSLWGSLPSVESDNERKRPKSSRAKMSNSGGQLPEEQRSRKKGGDRSVSPSSRDRRRRSRPRPPLIYAPPPIGYMAYGATGMYNPLMAYQQQPYGKGRDYYSSAGSVGGRSPAPPEMPLLSGVPPPGPMIRKPTSARPKSSRDDSKAK